MSFDRSQPYNSLPSVPPVGIELETKAVLKQAIAANRALAELKGAGEIIPNQSVLVRLIGLQEAKLSSEIENIVTTNDELYRAFADDDGRADSHTKEVLSYNTALWQGYDALQAGRPLSTRLFEELVGTIKRTNAGVRKTAGTKIVTGSGEAVYTPPEGEALLRDKLANLEQFLYADDDLDPLVKLAILHYQFEAIHPFTDGNGRTGRILNILYLVEVGLLDIPILYLSRYIIEHKSEYYSGLRCVTEEHAWEQWTLFMLRAVEETAQAAHRLILDIRALMRETSDKVRAELPKIYSKDLIEVLFSQPYCKIRFLEQGQIAQRQTASRYLKELNRIGVLDTPFEVGRENYYLNIGFYKLLTGK